VTETSGLSLAMTGGVIACVGTIAAGYPLLEWLKVAGVRQAVSADAPDRHASKAGTPTMGGLMMLAGLVLGGFVVMWAATDRRPAVYVVILAGAFGAIGYLDDLLIVKRGRNLGLTSRQKLLLQFLMAVLFVAWLAAVWRQGARTVVGGHDFGPSYYPLAVLFVVGLSNATNLADGLDGLAAGMSVPAFLALGLLHPGTAGIGFVLAGACAGFCWFNVHPALVFMGNTGALALGAAMAGIALIAKLELPLLIATAVFWTETLSVIGQVSVFKWRKRTRGLEYAKVHRLFLRAPLHHHFEELGWPENRIVGRFWVLSAVCGAVAVILGRTGWL